MKYEKLDKTESNDEDKQIWKGEIIELQYILEN